MMARAMACALWIIERDDRFRHSTACAAEETGGQIAITRIDVMMKKKFCKTTPCKGGEPARIARPVIPGALLARTRNPGCSAALEAFWIPGSAFRAAPE